MVPHEFILQELQSGVKSLPTVAQCPVNPEHKFRLHPDDTAIWGACDQCGFTGDSLDILRAKFKNTSVELTLCKLEEMGVLRDVPRDAISDYQAHKAKRESWNLFQEHANHRLADKGYDARVLNQFWAYPTSTHGWKAGFGRFAGSATKQELSELFGTSMGRASEEALVLPYYDMPGRMANMRIVSYNAHGMVMVDKPTSRSGGLFMLGSVAPGSEYVIAVDDPALACRIQMRQMESFPTQLPVVAWHPETRYWPITPKRAVFWAPNPTVQMFNQARKLPGACICTPRDSRDFEQILKENSIKNWVHHVMVESQPWCLALKGTLLSMPEHEAAKFARDLDITPLETGELLFECTADEKKQLSEILDLRTSVRNVMTGDSKVIDRDGAWWTHTDKGRLIRVTNAPFSIDRTAHYEGKGSYLVGTVTMGGKAEKFMAPADEFMSNPTKWLRKFTLQKGLGVVQTMAGWNHRLMEIAFSFGTDKPPHTDGKAIVGWTNTLDKFIFPNVALVSGRVDECDMGLPPDDMPCAKVTGHPTSRLTWRDFTDDSQVNRVFWAALAGIAANAGSKVTGHTPCKIGIVGPQRSMSLLETVLDLRSMHLNSVNGAGQKILKYTMHDIPVCLYPTCRFKAFVDWLEGSGIKNVLVSVTHAQAGLIGGPDWVFIDARDMSGAISHLHAGTNLLADAVRIIQRAIPVGEPIIEEQFLDKAHQWCRENKLECSQNVFTGAKKLITHGSMYGAVSTCEAFLFSLFAMIMDDEISVSRSHMSKKIGEVDISEKTVKVSKSILQKMVFPIGTAALTSELEAARLLVKNSPSEWHLDRTKWDEEYERWTNLREA